MEKQKDKVQLYLRPKLAGLWQSNACFALLFENMGVEASQPFCTTICLNLAKGTSMTAIPETL
jgi:hypothetical protein